MSVEKRRGCGFRKVGGTYLVSEGQGMPCDRLPIQLDVCPVCSHGFKQARGWTWVDLFGLVGGDHLLCKDRAHSCPVCVNVREVGKAGLIWIGEKFYPKPVDFMAEGEEMGFSRRVHALPRGFKVGETWVLLAHPKTISTFKDVEFPVPEDGLDFSATVTEAIKQVEVFLPGIFTLWRPTRVEKIFKESERDSDAVKAEIEKGVTPVFVPDNDKDHMGTAYDKAEEVEEEVEA
jgi:hypothetical protein